MSEEVEAGAAPAPVESVEAPVAEAAPAAEAVEAEPVADEAPVSEDISLSEETESGEGAPASFPGADEFDWEAWDANDDSFPDQVRPWASRLRNHYSKEMDTRISDMDKSREIYEALLSGQEDPRLGEYQTKIDAWTHKYNDAYGQLEVMQKEYEEYKKVVNEAIDQEAQEYADKFREVNSDIFNDAKLTDTFAELLEQGWELESAVVAARLPTEALTLAKKAKADGVPDSYALRLAEGAKSKSVKPRPGAEITSGATTPARSPTQAKLQEETSAMSLKDYRAQVARNALNRRR